MSVSTIARRTRFAVVLPAAAVIVLGVTLPAHAAGEGATTASTASTATPPGKGWIRAGHFVPGFGEARVDLAPKGSAAGASIVMSPDAAYGDVTSYQKLSPGQYVVTIRAAGSAADSPPMLSRAFEIKPGAANTIAVLGTATAPRLVVLGDDLLPPAAGTAKVRLLSATSQASSLSVAAVSGPTIASGAVLGQVTKYTTVPQGNWNLALTGATTPTQQVVSLGSGKVYTAVALDGGAGKVSIKLVTDASGVTATPKGGAAAGGGGLALAGGTPLASSAANDSAPMRGAVVGGLALMTLVGLAGAQARRRQRLATLSGGPNPPAHGRS